MTTGRIFFPGAPWPAGHNLSIMELSVRGGERGELRLHLHAESEPYDAEAPGMQPGEKSSPWERPQAWGEHRSMILSTTRWHNAGFELPTPRMTFEESKLDSTTLHADRMERADLDKPAEELACGLYLLGQNLTAGHELRLTRTGANLFDLHWTGKIALTWLNESGFDHDFKLTASGVRLSTIL